MVAQEGAQAATVAAHAFCRHDRQASQAHRVPASWQAVRKAVARKVAVPSWHQVPLVAVVVPWRQAVLAVVPLAREGLPQPTPGNATRSCCRPGWRWPGLSDPTA